MNNRALAAARRSIVSVFFVVGFGIVSACSIPSLEAPECDQARDVVREFYSLHFGNEQAFVAEELEKRKPYLTPAFFERIRSTTPAIDPFTLTSDTPKAFRAGECRVIEPGRRVAFELLLFWKTDTRTEQKAIEVEAENQNGGWLVDRVQSSQTISNDR
ncbi:MAG TPA: hypothetical protein VFZ23_05520 [Pyrinomonadaceae bacterium]